MSKVLMTAAAVLALAGCDQRRSEPFVGLIEFDEQQLRGQYMFFQQCNECHPQGESGLGPGLNDKPLPDFAIRQQVRRPIAFMPAFDEQTLPDAALEDLIEYLKAVRKAD